MATNTTRVLNKINAFVRPPESFLRPRPPPKKVGGTTTAASAAEGFQIVHKPDRALVTIPLWEIPRTDAEYKAAIRRMKMQDEPLAEEEEQAERPRHTTTRAAADDQLSGATPTPVGYPPGPAEKRRTKSREILRAPRLLSERALIHMAPRFRRSEQKSRGSRRIMMGASSTLGLISPAVTPDSSSKSVCESARHAGPSVDLRRRTRYRRGTESVATDDLREGTAHDGEMHSMAEVSPTRQGRISQETDDKPDMGRFSECYVCQEPCQSGAGLCSGCKDLFQPLSELFESSASEYEDYDEDYDEPDTPYYPSGQSLALPVTPPRSERREDSILSNGEIKSDTFKNWSEWSEWSEWAELSEPPASSQRAQLQAAPSLRSEKRVDSDSSQGESKGDSLNNWSEWSECSEWSELAKLSSSSQRTLLQAGTVSRSSSVSPTPHLARQLKVVPHHDIRKVSVTLPPRSNNNNTTTADGAKTPEDRQSALHHIQQNMRLREPLTPGASPRRQGRDAIRVGSVHSGEARVVDDNGGGLCQGDKDVQPPGQGRHADWFRLYGMEVEDGCGYVSDRDRPISPMTNCDLFRSCRKSCQGDCRDRKSAGSSTYDRIFSIYNTYCDQKEEEDDDGMF